MKALGETQWRVSLWASVLKLLRLRLIILVSGFRRASTPRKLGMIALWLLFIAFLGFIFFLSWALLGFLNSPELAQYVSDFKPFLDSVPVLIVSGAFIGTLLTSFGVLLQALYLAGDMDFLLSTPVPIRAVFITKLLQAILPNFGLICLFALPVLYGLGLSSQYNFFYYPLVLFVMIALALAAAGASSLLVMFVVRVFPARRVAEVLGFLGAILSFMCSQSGQLANMSEIDPEQASQAISLVSRLDTAWSPLAWAGRGLVAIGREDWLTGIGLLCLTLGIAGLTFGLALVTSERLYYTGWANMQSKSRKKKTTRQARPVPPARLETLSERFIPSAVRAILVKDYLVLRRDLRNMSQLVTPLIVGIIYTFMFLRSGSPPTPNNEELPSWAAETIKNTAVYFNVGLALFVSWMLLARLAGMGFSQEGKSYWILKSSPLSVRKLMSAKFLVAYLPVLTLSWIFLLVITLVQRASTSTLLFTLPAVALCIAGNAGINLAFGIIGANFDWEDPRRMQRGSSGCLAALITMLYLPFSLGLFFGPTILMTVLGLAEAAGQLIGLILGGLFSMTCALLPLWLVRKRVPLLGEPA
jgi:ABC-2 type transport system permease protein